MNPIVHDVLIAFGAGCFLFDFGISKSVTRVTCLGLAFLGASFLAW